MMAQADLIIHLHQACERGSLEDFKNTLLALQDKDSSSYIDFSQKFLSGEHNGCTVLHTAARHNCVSILEYIYSLGASLDVEDKSMATPLLYAIMRNSGDAVAFLISKGANPNTKDYYNNSALLKAITSNQYDLAEILIRGGADVNVKVGTKDQTVLDDACQRGDAKACKFLLDSHAVLLRKDSDDRMCLYHALPYPKVVELLLQRAVTANIFSKLVRNLDRDKYTVLHTAVLENYADTVSTIINFTSEYNPLLAEDIINEPTKDQQTPLHLAVKTKNQNISSILINCQFTNTNTQNSAGDTPMHIAIRNGCGNILESLLENDKSHNSLKIKNNDKFTPQELAKELQIDVEHVFNGFKESRFQHDFIGRDTIRKYRFVVFVFYRGSWCRACKNMLEKLNHIIDDVHALNGELIGVSSESAASRSVMKSLKLSYNVIDDEKGTLAKQLGVKIAKKNSHTIDGLIKLLKTHGINSTLHKIESNYPNGMAQPAIVIVRRDGQVVYRWISTPLAKNSYGTFERIEVPHIANLIKFYFHNVIQVESIGRYIGDHREEVLDNILTNSELRALFISFLEKEQYPQVLYFVEEMNNFIKEKAKQIFDKFADQQSTDAIKIPSSLRSKYDSLLEPDIDFLMELYLSAVDELKGERLDNFITTPEFIEQGIKMLPNTFTLPMDFDDLNEHLLTRTLSSPRMMNQSTLKIKRNVTDAQTMIKSKSFKLNKGEMLERRSVPITQVEKEQVLSNPKLIQEGLSIRDFVMKK